MPIQEGKAAPGLELRHASALVAAVLALAAAACGPRGEATDSGAAGTDAGAATDAGPVLVEDWTRDMLAVDLALDLTALTGTAALVVAPADSASASFYVDGLAVTSVTTPDGDPLPYRIVDGRLDVELPALPGGGFLSELTVAYGFQQWSPAGLPVAGGWLTSGSTILWPDYCSRLFPCKPDPADGLTYTLALTGVPAGEIAVYPASIDVDVPAYLVSFAVGNYVHEEIGVTPAGTTIGIWYLPGEQTAALDGTITLVDSFAWLETTYGPYPFGSSAGVVAVDWGGAFSGGFENHPYWHVSRNAMDSISIQVHEASHGWFGDGVRLRCWEDLVLSEGTASYLAARAIEAISGTTASDQIWQDYQNTLDFVVAFADGIAWPPTCGVVDPFSLLTPLPYMKGAFFYRDVELLVGQAALDAALAQVFGDFVGAAASMQDVLDAILTVTGLDPTTLADGWLRSLGTP